MVPPRIVYASQIDVTECSDPPRGYQGLHGFRNRALERRVLVGMLGKQPSRVRPVLAHLRHGRPAMGRNDRLQPSGVHRIDGTEHPSIRRSSPRSSGSAGVPPLAPSGARGIAITNSGPSRCATAPLPR